MASKSRKLRAALTARLAPQLEVEGFVAAYPMFLRIGDGRVDLIEVMFWQHGGGFLLELGRQVGAFEDWQGAPVPHGELTVAHLPLDHRARLQRRAEGVGVWDNPFGQRVPPEWLDYSAIWDHRAALDDLAEEVAALLPQAMHWFETGTAGPNVALYFDETPGA